MKEARIFCLAWAMALHALADPVAPCRNYNGELAVMVHVDQAMRSRWDWAALSEARAGNVPRFVEQTMLVDRRNTERFKRLVRSCGWPDRAAHGQSAVDDAWLIAQHADHDRKFQRAFLAEVQRQVKSGGGSPVQLAYLSDRLDVADGRPQKFGTQLTQKSACEFDFSPLDDREKVEARRKDLKWPPLDEYKKLVHETSLPPECKASAK